ncbi:DNA helicase RecQ [Salicibibacter kimchii]|uniref:DNA helicase RecQ n=1 Tax=Salicibibacter kimchii TaxID=2099786 RepID=A0A345BVH9_9BACI|nr:DNA helicase RecQ [Salicibibacter kimchii]AXF54960.1 DNA helicase RecQ [Salicibibacter kimchii]
MFTNARQLLHTYYGYDDFRPGQEAIIGSIFDGEHTMGIMPTGGGKSVCYQLPSLVLDGLTIVISPLIALMKDQVDEIQELGISATYLNSSLSFEEMQERLSDVQAGKYSLLYLAPERLTAPHFLVRIQSMPISLIAIDEAHCLSQWGHDFRPSYLDIPHFINQLQSEPVILALTATATPTVADDVCQSLGIPPVNIVKTGFARNNLTFSVIKGQDRDAYIQNYIENNRNESGIIYASTRKEVERIARRLKAKGFNAAYYHGGMDAKTRAESQEAFVYDEINVMVATNAFGMGINKSNVRYVIHAQIPRTMEAYYQEAGRAGRDGENSDCILLFSPQDIQIQQYLLEQSQLEDQRKANEFRKLREMVNYCHTESCLQAYILEYFGDENPDDCKRCFHCTDKREVIDVTKDAQMVLSCIKRMKQRFGKTIIAQVLTGSGNQKIKDLRFDQLSTYGLMKGESQKTVVAFIDFLTAHRYLTLTQGQYPVLQLSEKAVAILKGEQKVMKKEDATAKAQVTDDDPLFHRLRELRTALAKEHKVAPYMVFSDQTLKEMSGKQPATKTDMLAIKGVGEHKYEVYGEAFLSEIHREG